MALHLSKQNMQKAKSKITSQNASIHDMSNKHIINETKTSAGMLGYSEVQKANEY